MMMIKKAMVMCTDLCLSTNNYHSSRFRNSRKDTFTRLGVSKNLLSLSIGDIHSHLRKVTKMTHHITIFTLH